LGFWQRQINLAQQADLERQRQINLAQQADLENGRINLYAGLASVERLRGNFDGALRLAAYSARLDLKMKERTATASPTLATLTAAGAAVGWRSSLRGHTDIVSYAAFNRDGSRIATSSWDGTVRIWDGTTGAEIAVLNVGQVALMSVEFSPDGTKVVVGAWDNTARVLDVATGNEIAMLRGHELGVWYASFSPDGSRVVTASWD